MSSKFLLFSLIIFFAASCGVKSPPAKHPEQAIQSYIQEYTGEEGEVVSDQEMQDSSTSTRP